MPERTRRTNTKSREKGWLWAIVGLGFLLRVGVALWAGNRTDPMPWAYDQVFYHDVALNLIAGKGFVFTQPPWPFIEPGAPTAYFSFLYQPFLAAVYLVFGPSPLAARLVQAPLCSLMPWAVYALTRRLLDGSQRWAGRAGVVALAAAGLTAFYPPFVYYAGVLMTEGVYLLVAAWALAMTAALAQAPSGRRWALWGLAVGLAILLRQVFLPMAALLGLYVLWQRKARVPVGHLALAGGVVAALILPWTVRNYRVFDRFLLLNSQSGQVLWNANHPDHGVRFTSAMIPIPPELEGLNEVDLSKELGRRAMQIILDDPVRFARLSLNRLGLYFMFVSDNPASSALGVAMRVFYLAACLPLMAAGVLLSLREARRWIMLYGFVAAYTAVHVISWVQYRYRMLVDLALMPFAALAWVALLAAVWKGRPKPVSVEQAAQN